MMPIQGFIPIDFNIAAATSGVNTTPASEARLAFMPTKATIAMIHCTGAPRIIFLIAAVMKPDFSASPIAIIIISTMPIG